MAKKTFALIEAEATRKNHRHPAISAAMASVNAK
jgi:hypothetical protein